MGKRTRCLICKKKLPKRRIKYCSDKCMRKFHYHKMLKKNGKYYVNIPSFGKHKVHIVYTDGLTKELEPFVPIIRDKILKDCIKNPRKYL